MQPSERVLCAACSFALTEPLPQEGGLLVRECAKCGEKLRWHSEEWLPASEEVTHLFDQVVLILQRQFGNGFAEASRLAREYYVKFTDPSHCKFIGVPVQDEEFFFHEAPMGLALRAYYYLVLNRNPSPQAFMEWRNEYLRSARRT